MKKPEKFHVIATSFADPADLAGFYAAKSRGLSDMQAFRYGDNGIGCWGDDTTEPRPMVALPPEDWQFRSGSKRGALVCVEFRQYVITAELRDTMPHRENIKNGAGIDLNPAACAAFGLRPPVRVPVTWWWHDDEADLIPQGKPELRMAGRRLLAESISSLVGGFWRRLFTRRR